MRAVTVFLAAILVIGSGGVTHGSASTEADVATEALEGFNLPPDFEQLIGGRELIDRYQRTHYRVEPSQHPAPDVFITARKRNPRYVQTVLPGHSSEVLAYRTALPDNVVPLRSFRAPILERAKEFEPALRPSGLTRRELAAAEWVERHLAHEGLLMTLAHVIDLLDPAVFLEEPKAGIVTLKRVGFPTDLLGCFRIAGEASDEIALATWVAKRVQREHAVEALRSEFNNLPFRFIVANRGFRVASESGEEELGLLRIQADGGYRDGIVPGGTVDVICQAVAALPNAASLITLPREQLDAFELLARNWRLRHTNQVTLIPEPLWADGWAQDSGKAGCIVEESGAKKWATLAPRYASLHEGRSQLRKAGSFLMDGLRTAGHEVVHSMLMFQGGNILAVREPANGQRILLVGEGEIHRNVSLGLTREHILEAFRDEFGVDRCVIVPAVSYHLDFDITVRAKGSQVFAFVNDTDAAVREIVDAGLAALERGRVLSATATVEARSHLAAGRGEALAEQLGPTLRRNPASGLLPASLANCFVADRTDSASGNLQTFLLALDVLESKSLEPGTKTHDAERREYLKALRRMRQRCADQAKCLDGLGWTVVKVPSMIDLFRSINYINGIHHKSGYLMPRFGGFYRALDLAAAARFRSALGGEVRIQEIRAAECQRSHGGIHCAIAAYPTL